MPLPGGTPDVPWEDLPEDEYRIEVIPLKPGEILCAFIVDGVKDEDMDTAIQYWVESVCPAAAGSMTKFLNNHFTSRGD